ncbi:MAG TPA: hypothetical protein VH107_10580 [Lacipirellulaceae bacterium]|jgi:hypothetical protein|nr:hypothetical protein [Lacipirellulaceae bacterium]
MASKITKPEELAQRLANSLAGNLKCIALYGSAAAGDFLPGVSNFNVLVVADRLDVAALNTASPVIKEWSQLGHPTPLFFTTQQLANSTDAFPLELLDIQQSRRILWGDDLLAGLKIDSAHLRRQIERELSGKLLKLRARYLTAKHDHEAASDLMLHSLSTFLVLFRATLRLYQPVVPDVKLDALHALAKHISFETRPFEQLFALKQQTGESRSNLPDANFAAYLAAIERVTAAVNDYNQPNEKKS